MEASTSSTFATEVPFTFLANAALTTPISSTFNLIHRGLVGWKQKAANKEASGSHEDRSKNTVTESPQHLLSRFLAKDVFTDGQLQDWAQRVAEKFLPGEDLQCLPFSQVLTDPEFRAVVVTDDLAPGWHIQHQSPTMLTTAMIIICGLQRAQELQDTRIFSHISAHANADVTHIKDGMPLTKAMFYGVGKPGSGKSTSLKNSLDGRGFTYEQLMAPFKHVKYADEYESVVLGDWRPGLCPGTDSLEQAVKPKIVDYLRTQSPSMVIAEGERLMNKDFFNLVKAEGYLLEVCLFDISDSIAAERFQQRGSEWNCKKATWHKGLCTRVRNIEDIVTKKVDTTQTADVVAAEVSTMLQNLTKLVTINIRPKVKPDKGKDKGLKEHKCRANPVQEQDKCHNKVCQVCRVWYHNAAKTCPACRGDLVLHDLVPQQCRSDSMPQKMRSRGQSSSSPSSSKKAYSSKEKFSEKPGVVPRVRRAWPQGVLKKSDDDAAIEQLR
jgi:hypothetical protein